MQIDMRAIGGHLASLAWVALRSFAGTVLLLTLAGVLLAGASYYFLREQPAVYGVVAVVVALLEAVTVGVVLGAKRAVVAAVAHGLAALHLGRSLVGLVFDRMLGVTAEQGPGEPGGRLARGLERLPLAQADDLLSGAIQGLLGEAGQGGWLRQAILARLLGAVRKYTLARFREEGATHGGINLLKVREELEHSVDDVLVQKVRGGMRLWTVIAVVGLPLLVAAQTWAIILIVTSQG